MNTVTFNDSFTEDLRTAARERKWLPPEMKSWAESPLFHHVTNHDHVDKINNDSNDEGLPPLPFNIFRLHHTSISPKNQPIVFKAIMLRIDEGQIGAIVRILRGSDGPIKNLTMTFIMALREREPWKKAIDVENGEKPWPYCYDARIVHGNIIKDHTTLPAEPQRIGRQAMDSMWKFIFAFLRDCMLPQNHIAVVTPAVNGEPRSVQWKKARTHYTLISHGHPANRKEVQTGARVKDDAEGELTRMAHSRRAHWKTYRHERYRFARGERRFVRQCWVGPKEWQDEGGKQIYRILEPVDQ